MSGSSTNIKQLNQHLAQTGNNLKGLSLCPVTTHSLPGRHIPFYVSPLSHILSSDIDLHNHHDLRLLRFNFGYKDEKIRMSQDGAIRWFTSMCDSVTSKSLSIVFSGFTEWTEIWLEIQKTLLALNARIGNLSVYFSSTNWVAEEKVRQDNIRRLIPLLYEAGIEVVVLDNTWIYKDEMVCDCISTHLLFSLPPHLVSLSFPSMRLPSFSRTS